MMRVNNPNGGFSSLNVIAAIGLPILSALFVFALVSTPSKTEKRQVKDSNTAIAQLSPAEHVQQVALTPPIERPFHASPVPASATQITEANANAPTYLYNGVTVVTPTLAIPYIESPCLVDNQQASPAPRETASPKHGARRSHRSRVASRHRNPPFVNAARRFISALVP